MECLVNLLAVCLFNPSNIYVTADVLTPVNDARENGEGRWCNNRWCPGPIGAVTVGVRIDVVRGWSLEYGLRHESMLLVDNDRGQEFAFARLSWRPFR